MDFGKEASDLLKAVVPADSELDSTLETAGDLFVRLKMTKAESLIMRCLRDSRKKKEHLEKYIGSFSADTGGAEWQQHIWCRIKDRVQEILSAPSSVAPKEVKAPASATAKGLTSKRSAKGTTS